MLKVCYFSGQLKSVEEDISVVPNASDPDADKDYITIVKTTKVTTKIKQKTKNKNKNKKNKNKKAGLELAEDKPAAANETSTATTTTTVTTTPQKTDNNKKSSEDSSPDTTGNTPMASNENLADQAPNKRITVFEVDINKSTEESVFQNSSQQQADLNSTVLDSEDILSSYELVHNTTTSLITQTTYSSSKLQQHEPTGQESLRLSPSIKRKQAELEVSEDKSSVGVVKPVSKQARTEANNIYTLHALQTGVKYKLLDEAQKERILYLKPDCVELLMARFESHESISNSIQFSKLSFNGGLVKMVSRALDLLRHDKVESFAQMNEQLKCEYKIGEGGEEVTEALSDIVFGELMRVGLMEEKCLMRLALDKERNQPYEEVIDFGRILTMREGGRTAEKVSCYFLIFS